MQQGSWNCNVSKTGRIPISQWFLAESFAIIWNYIVAPLEKMLLLFYIGRTIGFLSGYTIWNFVKTIRHVDNEVLTFSQCFFLREWYAEWNRNYLVFWNNVSERKIDVDVGIISRYVCCGVHAADSRQKYFWLYPDLVGL